MNTIGVRGIEGEWTCLAVMGVAAVGSRAIVVRFPGDWI